MKSSLKYALPLALASLAACGERGGGTAKVAFANGTGALMNVMSSPLSSFAPFATEEASTFQMKLIAVYLTEDIAEGTGNNVGQTAMVYLNNDCQDDIMHCDISGGNAEDGQPMSKVISSYFDFAQDSAAVNTAINAQGRSISAGTYKYARIEFCKYNNENANNIKWAAASTPGTVTEFKRNSCTVNSAEFATPITVTEGGSVTVTLSYDLSATVETGASSQSGDSCTGTSAPYTCFTMPTFVPSAQ
jgi:hypothetical protein